MRPHASLLLAVIALGCTDPATQPGPVRDDETTPTTSGTTSDSPTSPSVTDTASPTDSGAPTTPTGADCANLPAAPLARIELGPQRGYHGLAIDADGFMLGLEAGNLIAADRYGDARVLSPSAGTLQQLDWLPDGGLVAGDSVSEALVRFDPITGGASPIAANVGWVYGVRLGPDGMIYVANEFEVLRVDPATGERTLLIDPRGAYSPRVLDWSPDYTKLYVGTKDGQGDIYVVDLDVATLDPISPPALFATGTGGYHDCLGVDECGNLLVCDYTSRGLYRVTPDGVVDTLVAWSIPDGNYGHGLVWGTGQHGWSETSVFLPQPYDDDTVVELDLGVRSRYAVAPAWP